MTPLRDPSNREGSLPFALLISRILEDMGFAIDPPLRVQATYAFLDGSSWAKYYSHDYGLMEPLAHHGPQDAAP